MLSSDKHNLSKKDIKAAGEDEKETLLEYSDLDEDMLFSRPSTSNESNQIGDKMDCIRLQIQEVTEVMRDNVQKVIDRGEKLENLEEASDCLNITGYEFREAARKAQRRAWLQNVKSRIIIISVTMTIILLIIVSIIVRYT